MAKAIFGGTFDPVHRGHTAMAESALRQFDISEIIIVPNGNPPHKSDNCITDFVHRFNMLCLAFEGFDRVKISDYEANEDKPSYSVYTMRHFRKVYGEDTYFIVGADSLLSIHKWYDADNLLKENRFIVFRREGDLELDKAIEWCRCRGADIHLSEMPRFDVSSTGVRRMISDGEISDGALCARVRDYIKKNGLYGGLK